MKKIFIFIIILFYPHLIKAQEGLFNQQEIDSLHIEINKENNAIKKMMHEFNSQIESTNDSITKSLLKLKYNDLWTTLELNATKKLLIDIAYAKQHPSSLQALKLISNKITGPAAIDLYDDYELAYNSFSSEVKISEDGKKLAEHLKYFRQSKVGSIAPEFILIDVNGEKLALSDFENKKYVLIDFWASWCKPCAGELPYIKELYKKYSNGDFEIISISTDKDSQKWKNAILKEQIGVWKHSSREENKSSVSKDYFVFGIPHKVLIDKNGIIIGKWIGLSDKNNLELKKLLSEKLDLK